MPQGGRGTKVCIPSRFRPGMQTERVGRPNAATRKGPEDGLLGGSDGASETRVLFFRTGENPPGRISCRTQWRPQIIILKFY